MSDSVKPIEIDAGDRAHGATSAHHTFQLRAPELWVRLPILPEAAERHHYRFELVSDEGGYRQSKTVRDDKVPGDDYIDLVYTDIKRGCSYTLQVIEPDRDPYSLFENVAYEKLPGLQSWHAHTHR